MRSRTLYNARGPALVALWAFAPALSIQTDTVTGLPRITFAGGTGAYEIVTRSCSGEVLDTESFSLDVVGGQGDFPLHSGFRGSVFGGYLWNGAPSEGVEVGPGVLVEGGDGGVFAGGALIYEEGRIGAGLGVAAYPGLILPSVHFRFGDLGDPHVLVELAPPTPTPAAAGLARVGLGVRTPTLDGAVGLSSGRPHGEAEFNTGPYFDVNLGLTDRFGVKLEGSYHFSEGSPDWGLAAGLQWRLGG